MTQIVFDPKAPAPMTPRDYDLVVTIRTCMRLDKQDTFDADYLYRLGLDRYFTDKQHSMGAFFHRLKTNGLTTCLGWHCSKRETNHGRKIQIWEWRIKEATQT